MASSCPPLPPLSAEEIAKKVEELTKGSAFDQRKEEKRRRIEARVGEMKQRLAATQPAERDRIRLLVEKAVDEAERARNLSRVMVHVDMDAFYASVEIRDQPHLADKPVAVGGNSMLSTCNYVARTYGARSGMPGFVAKKLCPHLIILPPDFRKYTSVARQVREVFAEYCPDFVSGGLDEAYLDITDYLERRLLGNVTNQIADFKINDTLSTRVGCRCDAEVESSQPRLKSEALYCPRCKLLKCNVGEAITFGNSAWSVVEEIRFKILLATRLTSSGGIAPNTMIAKIASDLRKPNGQYMVRPDRGEILQLMADMPVAKVPFIGPVSQGELAGLGVVTCGDLRNRLVDVYQIYRENHFEFFLHAALGIGSTQLEHGGPRKSIGTETTFEKTGDLAKLLGIVRELCQEVAESLQDEQLCGRTLTLKIKTATFYNLSRAGSCPGKGHFMPSNKGQDLYQTAKHLLEKEFQDNNGQLFVRLLGVRVSNLKDLAEITSEAANSEPTTGGISAFLAAGKKRPRKTADDDDDDVIIAVKRSSDEFLDCDCVIVEQATNDDGDDGDSAVINASCCYQCPICNAKFPRMTLLRFNEHIDECLTRSTIRSIKEQDRKTATEAKTQQPQQHDKKNRNRNSHQKSILNFLKPRQP